MLTQLVKRYNMKPAAIIVAILTVPLVMVCAAVTNKDLDKKIVDLRIDVEYLQDEMISHLPGLIRLEVKDLIKSGELGNLVEHTAFREVQALKKTAQQVKRKVGHLTTALSRTEEAGKSSTKTINTYERQLRQLKLKKRNDSLDMDSLVSQVNVLQQTVATLQQDSKAQNEEILELKTEVLQSQREIGNLTSDVNALKDALSATKTELRSMSNEVNAGFKIITSEYSSLQMQINDADKVFQDFQVSVESDLQLLNSSLQTQIHATHSDVDEVSSNKYVVQSFQKNLDVVNSSMSDDLANFKQTTNNNFQILQHETSDLHAQLNSTQITLKDRRRLLDSVVNTLDTTMTDTSLLKTTVALLSHRVFDFQTTSNKVAAMSSRMETMNKTIQTQVAVTRGNMNSIHNLQANLTTINSTLMESDTVLKTELNSLVSSVMDHKFELGTALKRFNATEKETSLLQTDVALINSKLMNMTRNFQTTAQTVSGMSSIVDRLNVEVSFEVMRPAYPYARDTPIQFTDVKHNVGGGYNSTSGTFTAPVSGIYLFWSQVRKRSGAYFYLGLYHNTNWVTGSIIPVAGEVTGTVIAGVSLNAGDTVYVTASTANIHNGFQSTFGGVLLRRH